MAIVQALLAALARSAGRLLNTAFGWATTMIFGKVPQDRQIYLSVIAFGSIVWILVVVGIAFPTVGTFLLAFVPLPDWVSKGLVRLAMLALAIVVPPVVGVVSLFLKDPADRPRGAGAKARAILKGRTLARRWSGQHVPMVVDADDYEAVVAEMAQTLRQGGWAVTRQPASWLLRAPTRVLTTLAGGSLENLVAKRLTTLRSDRLEVTLHPSDLVLEGKTADVVRARALLAGELAFSKAHLTWTKEGNELEDAIEGVWHDLKMGASASLAMGRLRAIEEELRRVEIPFEEWEVLFRAKLLVQVAAHDAGVQEPDPSWIKRTLVPLALGITRQALQSPPVRAQIEQTAVTLLRSVTARACEPASRPAITPRRAA